MLYKHLSQHQKPKETVPLLQVWLAFYKGTISNNYSRASSKELHSMSLFFKPTALSDSVEMELHGSYYSNM